jgi:hypothetical protein
MRHPLGPPTVPLHDVIGLGLFDKIMRDTGLDLHDIFAD